MNCKQHQQASGEVGLVEATEPMPPAVSDEFAEAQEECNHGRGSLCRQRSRPSLRVHLILATPETYEGIVDGPGME